MGRLYPPAAERAVRELPPEEQRVILAEPRHIGILCAGDSPTLRLACYGSKERQRLVIRLLARTVSLSHIARRCGRA